MKNLSIYVVLFSVLLSSCGKDDEPSGNIVGKWKYESIRKKQTDPSNSTNNTDETTTMTTDSYIEFKSDGTTNSRYAKESTNPNYIEEYGEYTISGDNLTLIQDFGSFKISIVTAMQFTSDDDLKLYHRDNECELNFDGDIGTCETWIHLTK